MLVKGLYQHRKSSGANERLHRFVEEHPDALAAQGSESLEEVKESR